MDVRNCRTCGRMFNYLGGPPICPVCRKATEEKFMKVRDYIRENPNATIQSISDENEVSIPQIQQWIREERLEFSKDSPVTLSCENCGASIRTGRFCEKCKNNMANNLTDAFREPEAPPPVPKKQLSEKDAMRFLKK